MYIYLWRSNFDFCPSSCHRKNAVNANRENCMINSIVFRVLHKWKREMPSTTFWMLSILKKGPFGIDNLRQCCTCTYTHSAREFVNRYRGKPNWNNRGTHPFVLSLALSPSLAPSINTTGTVLARTTESSCAIILGRDHWSLIRVDILSVSTIKSPFYANEALNIRSYSDAASNCVPLTLAKVWSNVVAVSTRWCLYNLSVFSSD